MTEDLTLGDSQEAPGSDQDVQEAAAPEKFRGLLDVRRLAPTIVVLFGIVIMIESWKLELGTLMRPGLGLWPFITGAVVTITALALFFVDRYSDYARWTRKSLYVAIAFVGLLVFVPLFQMVGYTIPAFLLVFLWLKAFQHSSWLFSVGMGLITSVVLYILFKTALGVPFPKDAVMGLVGL